ncbi:hypothetical protein Hanom_Chr07g00669221 [Helianthus anomalus]
MAGLCVFRDVFVVTGSGVGGGWLHTAASGGGARFDGGGWDTVVVVGLNSVVVVGIRWWWWWQLNLVMVRLVEEMGLVERKRKRQDRDVCVYYIIFFNK